MASSFGEEHRVLGGWKERRKMASGHVFYFQKNYGPVCKIIDKWRDYTIIYRVWGFLIDSVLMPKMSKYE